MKRSLVWALCFLTLLCAAFPAYAVDLKWGGDYRLRGFYIDNLSDQNDDQTDSAAYYSSRFLLTTTAAEENVTGVVTLILGNTNGTGNRLLGETSYGPDASEVSILEAYLQADFDAVRFKGGRQVFKLGTGIIFEDAIDGLKLDGRLGPVVLTAAAFKAKELTEGGLVGIGNSPAGKGTGSDADFYVLNAGFGDRIGPMRNLNLFLAYLLDREATLFGGGAETDDADLRMAGLSAQMEIGSLRIHGEIDYLSGNLTTGGAEVDLSGMNLALGAKLERPIPIGIDLIYASGDDPNDAEVNVNGINGNYPIGIIITNVGARSLAPKDGTCLSINGGSLGGVPNCIGGSGLIAAKLSTGLRPGRWEIDLAGIWAKSAEDSPSSGERDIGIEIDATAAYALTKRLHILGGVGYLLTGDFFKSGTNPDPDNMVVLVSQLSYTF